MLKVEFHCHTWFSSDSRIAPAALVVNARKKGIDRLVVTDHNTILGAKAAQVLDPEMVIIGEEVLTQRGELLAAFVQEEVPPHLPPLEAVKRLKQQGAFISVSHPFDWQRSGWSKAELLDLLPHLDAIEVFNSRSLHRGVNEHAARFAREYGAAGTVGSDAHLLWEVGRSTMTMPEFSSADELREAIRVSMIQAELSPLWVHFGSTFARLINGIVGGK
ncbi:MAG: PHP domain-containing protein [Anaerolineae bacterium]|nr:PHP domain-containing protein [Anaerolineae bacterium]